jgi:hypothetical protein
MHQLLFRNRFNALIFVALILFSVPVLVGTEGERGAIETATQQLGAEPQANAATARGPAQAAPEPAPTEFTPDEELIDDTAGLDPSGWSDEVLIDEGPPIETADIRPAGFEQ